MQKARVSAIVIGALLAVTAALVGAAWMSRRTRASAESEGGGSTSGTEVEIEIPSAAGPSTAARIDGVAPLDPGKALDAGGPPSEGEVTNPGAEGTEARGTPDAPNPGRPRPVPRSP